MSVGKVAASNMKEYRRQGGESNPAYPSNKSEQKLTRYGIKICFMCTQTPTHDINDVMNGSPNYAVNGSRVLTIP